MERSEQHPPQRLVLCLDGTWNQRDSGTNIYHLSNLIVEGEVTNDHGTWRQFVQYQEGVGTGVLDSVTGGAFGFGLSKNVRDAYDWLVEKYCDGDEIYVFGFSRGAFTARSLVGLITKCGLLRRGAPVPPEELWHAYKILGRYPNPRTGMEPDANWWERIFGKPKRPFRELQELRRETWEIFDPNVDPQAPVNRAERLLMEWSRRVPIHCVGVFDTVGALGVNALAIPWVRDVTAQFHDARLTTLVINGFQALAIDEHRASFAHIPWFREIAAKAAADRTVNGGHLEQRWFIGSHSNLGGGYEDDVLAMRPLAWMIGEVSKLGLVFHAVAKGDPNPAIPLPVAECGPLLTPRASLVRLADQAGTLRDSFREFAGGIWQHFIRAKREHRRLAPPCELQNGVAVRSLNEKVDESVLHFHLGERAYLPPNLWRYWQDQRAGGGEGSAEPFSSPPPAHRYSDAGWRWWSWLGLWLALIALTGWKAGGWLDAWHGPLCGAWSWRWLAAVAPFLALLVDWRESALYHQTSLFPEGPQAEKKLAWMDVYLGIRLGAIAAAAAGIALFAFELAGPWLRRDWPVAPGLWWLLALDGLWLVFQANRAWSNGPMTDAGLSSIVDLQRARHPAAVHACLVGWAKGHAESDRQLLMPAVRALWRDMLIFIPTYTVVLFVGSWLALSLARPYLGQLAEAPSLLGLLSCDRRLWLPALAAAIVCALADYVEDWSELRFVERFPRLPSRGAVWLASAATAVKVSIFAVGFVLTVGATLWLSYGPLRELVALRPHTLGVAAAICAIALVAAQVKTFVSAVRHPR